MSSFSLVLFLLAQAITLAVLVELLVRFMPPALRRLSESNSYRPDGMISENRKSREVRAKRRLRIIVGAILLVPLVAATAITVILDRISLPLPLVIQAIGLEQADVQQWQARLQQQGVLASAATAMGKQEGLASVAPEEAFDKLQRAATLAKTSFGLWALLSGVWSGIGLWWAYRGFERAAKQRQQRNQQNDHDRMSGKTTRFTVELPAQGLPSQNASTQSASTQALGNELGNNEPGQEV